MADIAKISTHQPQSPPTAYDVLQAQDGIVKAVNQLLDRPGSQSSIVKDVSLLSASTVDVRHKLGRSWVGWYVVDQDADARIWRDTTSSADDGVYLPLKCSADVNVKLVVF